MDLLLQRTLRRHLPLALTGLAWATVLGLLFCTVGVNQYPVRVCRWLELVVPGAYLSLVISAWCGLGRGRALEELSLVLSWPRLVDRWGLGALRRALGLWLVLVAVELVVSQGWLEPTWLLVTPPLLATLTYAGLALAAGSIPLALAVSACFMALCFPGWMPVVLLGLREIARRRPRLPGRLTLMLAVALPIATLFVNECPWAGLLTTLPLCLALLGAQAAASACSAMLAARESGLWDDLGLTPWGRILLLTRQSCRVLAGVWPASVALGLLLLACLNTGEHFKGNVLCGMPLHPHELGDARTILRLALVLCLVVPLAACRLGSLLGCLTLNRTQAALWAVSAGVGLLALGSFGLMLVDYHHDGSDFHLASQLLVMLPGLSLLIWAICTGLLMRAARDRLGRPGPFPAVLWLPLWLALAKGALRVWECCGHSSIVLSPFHPFLMVAWTAALGKGIVASLAAIWLYRRLALPCPLRGALIGLLGGLWAGLPLGEVLRGTNLWLTVVGLVLGLLLDWRWLRQGSDLICGPSIAPGGTAKNPIW